MLIVIRTTSGRENAVINSLISRIKSKKLPIKALVQTEELRGYVFVEADEINEIQDAIRGIPHVRGIMEKEITMDQFDLEEIMDAVDTYACKVRDTCYAESAAAQCQTRMDYRRLRDAEGEEEEAKEALEKFIRAVLKIKGRKVS